VHLNILFAAFWFITKVQNLKKVHSKEFGLQKDEGVVQGSKYEVSPSASRGEVEHGG
jgi:hypothetical protein